MAVLRALRRTGDALGRNPILLAVTAALALVQFPQIVAQWFGPLVSALVSLSFSVVLIAVVPFFQGGLLGMADEALDGTTSLGTFVDAGKSNYLTLLGAYALVVAVAMVFGGLVVLPLLFGGIFAFTVDGSTSAVALLLVGGFVLLVGLAYLLGYFFVQFYGQAIVLDDQGIVDGFRRSAAVVRSNLAPTLGYTALLVVLGAVFGVVAGVASVFLAPQQMSAGAGATGFSLPDLSLTVQLALAVVLFVATALFSAVFLVFSVAFYREIRDEVA